MMTKNSIYMPKAIASDIERDAVALVEGERNEWEDAIAHVTPLVAFNMRNLIKSLRKNYYGIFEDEVDPTTGQKKTWVPLTESTVDAIVKNIDLDTKDINLRAKNAKAIGLTSFMRQIIRAKLDQMHFGEYLDEMERMLAIDGTAVWKTYTTNGAEGKTVRIKLVDIINFYIEPTAPNIQEATAIIERAVMTPGELRSMDGWMNTEDVEASSSVSRNDRNLTSTGDQEPLIDVYERWGLMPKSFITGEDEDKDEYIEGHIVVSGLDEGGGKVHLVEENKIKDSTGKVIKPYEEIRYKKVPGRWHGRGPAEALMMLQVWMNTVVNVRINRARVSQLGIFKIRKGSGVTPQMLSRLTTNGAVVLNNMDDLQQLVVQEASQASYTDEQVIQSWSERVTSAFEAVTGEQLPASTPATNAVLQQRIAQSQFVMIKEQIGMFLQRWLKRHYIPKLGDTVTKEEIVVITGEPEEIADFDEKLANKLMKQKLEEALKMNLNVDPAKVRAELQRVKEKARARSSDRFVKLMKLPETTDYEVQVFHTNEEIDKSVMVQNLISMMQTVAQVPGLDMDVGIIAKSVFDVMGLDTRQFEKQSQLAPQPMQQGAMSVNAPQQGPPENPSTSTEQRITSQANTM